MQVIDMATMKEAIKQIVIRKNRPCIFIGPSGCGKTEGADQVQIEEDIFLARFLLGQYDSVDMKGTPWVRTRDGYQDTVWHPASTLPFEGNPAFPDDRIILLHFDEATSGTVPVLGIMYQLTQERRVGEHKLKDNVRIMLSGNRESDKGIVNRFPMPLCNRLTWYELQPTVQAFSLHAHKIGVDPVCVAFLNWQKTKLHTFDPKSPDKVFATPRSWVTAMEYYSDTKMSAALKEASISGSIGAGVCAEFYAFVEHWRTIAKLMPAILKTPEKAEVPTEPSMQYSVADSISGSMTTEANCTTYNTYLKRMPPEFAVMAWSLAVARDDKLYGMRAWTDFSRANKAIWQ